MQLDLNMEDVSLKRHIMSVANRHEQYDSLNKRSFQDSNTNLFIFLTGHGGDKYMKIQYLEIFFSQHFADSIEDAYIREKYKQVLTISDTCSAGTLFYNTTAKNGIFYGSSGWDSYSLSEGFDKYIGQPLKDRFTYRFQKWIKKMTGKKQFSFEDFVSKSLTFLPK
jgi:phosphatidylinositol glycan class K